MKILLSLIISGVLVVFGYGQTRNVLVGTNNAVVQPTNFWSADASNARSGLGLGSAATNPSSAFQPSSSVLSNLVSGGAVNLTNVTIAISNVSNLQSSLDAKLGTNPTLNIANISNLQTTLDGKLGTNPTLQISNIAALQAALDGKLSGSFPIAISNVSGLQASLDGKLGTNPTLSIANISGLQTNLDSKLSVTGNAVNLTNFPASLLRTTGDASGLTNFPTLNQNTTGTASNVTGVVAIANGGTGTNSVIGARQNLGLSWSGLTNISAETFRAALGLGSLSTLSAVAISNVTGLQTALDAKLASNGNAINLTNFPTIPISSGGTGATNVASARAALGLGSASTNPATAFQSSSLVLSNLASSNAADLTNLRATNIVGIIPSSNIPTVSLTNISGTLAIVSGGTGATNSGGARTNLGLGATNNVAFNSVYIGAGDLQFSNDSIFWSGALRYSPEDQSFEGGIGINNGSIQFIGTNAAANIAATRTNLGLGATWLTNTNVTNFRTAIGLGALGSVVFEEVLILNSIEVANGAPSGITIDADGIQFGATNAAITRSNLGLGWPALTNSNAGTGLVSVNTNGDVVSPTNFWQRAPIQTTVQDFTGITVNQTNNATNARNVYVYSLVTNVSGISNTIILPTNASTFNGDEITVVHKGTTNTTTVVRQAGSTNNLITLNKFDESVKFIRELGQWDFYHNISFVEPIQFSGTNASANIAATRTNLGLGATNAVTFAEIGANFIEVDYLVANSTTNVSSIKKLLITGTNGIEFNEGEAISGTRTNLGLGATWLTNTNVTNFRTAIGLGATNQPTFSGMYVSDGTNAVFYAVSSVNVFELYSPLWFGDRNSTNAIFQFEIDTDAAIARTNLGLGGSNIVTFAGITNNGDIRINQTTPTNGLLFVYRTNNEPFLGIANLIASNNTTVSNETLFRVGVAEATNRAAQFGFRATNTNGNGVAVFSVFGYNALMMIGPSDPNAGTNPIQATVSSINPTNRVMTLITTNTGAMQMHRPIEWDNATNSAVTRTNLGLGLPALTNTSVTNFQKAIFHTNTAPSNIGGNLGTIAAWIEIVASNGVTYKIPAYTNVP